MRWPWARKSHPPPPKTPDDLAEARHARELSHLQVNEARAQDPEVQRSVEWARDRQATNHFQDLLVASMERLRTR